MICANFAHGCGGKVVEDGILRDGPAAFYGIGPGMEPLWRGVQDGRDWFLIDNSYFDSARGTYYRVTKNRLQHSGLGTSDGSRFRALGIEIEPWRLPGNHIVVCPQSEHFMRSVGGYGGDWAADVVHSLQGLTDRPIMLRLWGRDKSKQAANLHEMLDGAHAVVTWSSAAAITALLSGIPAVCMGQSAAEPMATPLAEIESPRRPDGREEWGRILADNQWTLAEMAGGFAWGRVA